jgi:hypothetical protein
LDDDQLAGRTGIHPRQTVNQICRALAAEGVLRRSPGPDQKIVNELSPGSSATTQTTQVPDTSQAVTRTIELESNIRPPGDSREQRDAERTMLDILGAKLGLTLDPARITVPSGARVEVDGSDAEPRVPVECWAHQAVTKAAQRHKVLTDALKLTWISSTIYRRPRLILCLSDSQAAAPFLPGSRSWAAQALHDLTITIEVVDLPEDLRAQLRTAQQRQYR